MTAWDWNSPEVKNSPLVDAQCSIFVGNFLSGNRRCEESSTHLVTAGCVHEHVFEYATCAEHGPDSKPMFCNRCTDSAESHECPLLLDVAPLPESVVSS